MCDRPCCSPTEILLGILGKEVNFKSVKNAPKFKKKYHEWAKLLFWLVRLKVKNFNRKMQSQLTVRWNFYHNCFWPSIIYLSTVLKLSPSPSTLQLCFGSTCPALILVVIAIVPLFLTRLNNVSYVSIVPQNGVYRCSVICVKYAG